MWIEALAGSISDFSSITINILECEYVPDDMKKLAESGITINILECEYLKVLNY